MSAISPSTSILPALEGTVYVHMPSSCVVGFVRSPLNRSDVQPLQDYVLYANSSFPQRIGIRPKLMEEHVHTHVVGHGKPIWDMTSTSTLVLLD